MNYTQNYQLCLWDEDDRILMEDFNADNAKIDTALAAHDGKLDWLGNCRVETGSYVGTGECGEEHPNTLTLSGPAVAVLLCGPAGPALLMRTGNGIHFQKENDVITDVTVSGNTISWFHVLLGAQMNVAGETYRYVAFAAKE